ncbi:DNA-binding protein [uncultured Moraxella sp.]|uniref:DNA-binding protein n=1 Tax=uncultured Moraxella sp. TaxID=263769 RepID=UPI0025F87CB4|nr:DNA-binding protein [uncultured Moraxella sp.]
MANNPTKGDVIPNAKGLRKIRYAAKGHGKRGGARVIYYNMLDDGLIIAVAIYPKNEREDLSNSQMKQLVKHKELL